MPGSLLARAALLGGLVLTLGACQSIESIFETKKTPLPGERISILALESNLEPDPRIADLEVRLPRPYANEAWPQSGGYPSHAMHHLELQGGLTRVWSANIGTSAGSHLRISAQPVVAEGRVFAMDAAARVSAYDIESGKRLWRTNLTPPREDGGAFGGGLAHDRGTLYVTTPYGEVFALDAGTGRYFWRQRIGIPLRGAPTVDGNRVFAISYDNQLHALNIEDGEVAWTYSGIPETAGLFGGASPASDGGLVVAPFSSGELVALRADTGRVAWSDSLVRSARTSSLASINDINAAPVIDRGRVIAVGSSGRMVAVEARSGERLWDQSIGGSQTPWVAGDFVFMVTSDAEVICLSRRDGRIRWVHQLERYENPERKRGLITWFGPVLASDRLILVSSHGYAVSLSPYRGEMMGAMRLPDPAAQPPVVAANMLFVLTDSADLVAYR